MGGDSYLLPQTPTEAEADSLLRAANGHSALVLGSFSGHLRPEMRKLLARLDQVKAPVLAVAFGLPYDLGDTPPGTPGLAAWEYSERSVEAVLAVLKGERPVTGRIPVKLE